MATDADVSRVVPFLSVSDMEACLRYYVEGLSFVIEHTWEVSGRIRWCSLRRGGARLMLQEFPPEGADSWRPEGQVGEGVSLWFMCDDALRAYERIVSRGLGATVPQVGNGMWVTSLEDPDGYRLHFESPTDVAEGTRHTPSG